MRDELWLRSSTDPRESGSNCSISFLCVCVYIPMCNMQGGVGYMCVGEEFEAIAGIKMCLGGVRCTVMGSL